LRPHGCEIRKINREHLVAQGLRVDIGPVVTSLHQGIGSDHDLVARRHGCKNGGVVPDAQGLRVIQGLGPRTDVLKKPVDESELTHDQVRGALGSARADRVPR
jgi:hypothetical protein